jgi:hypothetical protein
VILNLKFGQGVDTRVYTGVAEGDSGECTTRFAHRLVATYCDVVGGATVHISETVWNWVSIVALAGVGLIGLPFLLMRGGGRRRGGRGGRRGRGGYRVRVGPSTPVSLAVALLRRLDTVMLVAATVAIVVLVVWNAQS